MNRILIIGIICISSVFTQNALGQISLYTSQQYQTFFLKQKEIDSKYLFYSHKTGTLETLFFLDEERKLALSSDRTYLVLLNKSNLHYDTLKLDDYMPLEMPPVFSGDDLYFVSLSNFTKLEEKASQFQASIVYTHKKAEMAAPLLDGFVGPDRKSVKKQNAFPAFKFYKDKKPTDLIQPLPFIKKSDINKVVPSVYNISFRYYETPSHFVIFPVETQQLVRIDKKTKAVSLIQLPYKSDEVICYYFNDHVQNQQYVLKHYFNTGFMELFQLDNKKKALTFAKSIPYFPEAIVNGSLYCRELDELGSVSHYLIPIKSL